MDVIQLRWSMCAYGNITFNGCYLGVADASYGMLCRCWICRSSISLEIYRCCAECVKLPKQSQWKKGTHRYRFCFAKHVEIESANCLYPVSVAIDKHRPAVPTTTGFLELPSVRIKLMFNENLRKGFWRWLVILLGVNLYHIWHF